MKHKNTQPISEFEAFSDKEMTLKLCELAYLLIKLTDYTGLDSGAMKKIHFKLVDELVERMQNE